MLHTSLPWKTFSLGLLYISMQHVLNLSIFVVQYGPLLGQYDLLLMFQFSADRYKRYPFYLWWGIYWLGKNYFREVTGTSNVISISQILLLNLIGIMRSWRMVSDLVFLWWFVRRQDSSIGFGAPVRANMRTGGLTDAVLTSSLLESVRINTLSSNMIEILNLSYPVLRSLL